MIREFVLSSAFTDVGFSLVGNEVDLYFTSTQTKTPDKGGSVDCHQDIAYDRERNEKRVICWTSITESHPDNGGLFVWPSSHKRGLLPHAPSRFFELDLCTVGVNLEDTVPVSMDPGEIMVIHNSLVHGSYPNRTKNTRVALLSGYQKPKTYSETELKIVLPVLRA